MSDLFQAVLADKTARSQTAARKVAVQAADSFTPWASADA